MNTNPILEAALEYRELGWSIIPLVTEEKKAARRWKQYQRWQAHEDTLRRWFKKAKYGVGVVYGQVSGGLVARDFDQMEAYETWAKQHPDLAQSLPTVETRRGRHVYARATQAHVLAIRESLGKPNNTGALRYGDGEVRLGVGCYCVVPPSVHPEGHVYRWLIPPRVDLPELDLWESGFVPQCGKSLYIEDIGFPKPLIDFDCVVGGSSRCVQSQAGQLLEVTTDVRAIKTLSDLPEGHDAVAYAIQQTLPTQHGERGDKLFQLARILKSLPQFVDAPVESMREHVSRWYELAEPHIRTKSFLANWGDFKRKWKDVKFPIGQGPLDFLWSQALVNEVPECARRYAGDKCAENMVKLCRELQRVSQDQPFFLACRAAGFVLGFSHTAASHILNELTEDGILQLVKEHDYKARTARYFRYLGDL